MKEKIKKILHNRIVSLFGILLFIGACIGVGAGIAYVEHNSDPTEQAALYFRAFVQKDYEKMYSYLQQEDECYVDKSLYIAKIKAIREGMVIDAYEIGEPEKKDGRIMVTMECKNEDTGKSENFHIYFDEERTGIQIIPDYYINVDDYMVSNITITVPKNDHLELNGQRIPEEKAQIATDEKGNKTYKFNKLFAGKYRAVAANDFYATVKSVKIKKDKTNINLIGNDYTANDTYAKILEKQGNNLIKQFYKAVRNRKPDTKQYVKYFSHNKKLLSKAKKWVELSQKEVYWPEKKNIDDYKVKKFKMGSLSPDISYDTKSKKYTLTYNYTYSYTSATDTALYNSYVYSLSGKCRSTMKIIFELNGRDVRVSDISVKNKNSKE